MADAPLLAVSYVNPLLLGGLALTAVPVIIHLFSRRQFRRVAWGATRFLLEAEKISRRRRRFEQWLLVALRSTAMALLALLLARPFVQPGLIATLLGGQERAQRIIVLDDSASLSYRVGGEAELERLARAAERLLSWLHQDAPADPVTIYLTSAPQQPLLEAQPVSDTLLEDLRGRLKRLAPRPLPARARAVFERVAERLGTSGRGVRSEVYVLSDFQRSDWLASTAEQAVFAPLRNLEGITLRVVPIASGVTPRDNVAVHDLRQERRQTLAGQPTILTARVANHTRARLERVALQLELDGSPVPAEPIERIEPEQEQKVSVEVTFPEEGLHEVTLAVSSLDRFAWDDACRLAVRAKESLPVLLVNGQPATDPQRDEVHLLRTALAPPGAFTSGIRVEVIDPSELEGTDLGSFDCVMLCNVGPVPPGAVAALERFAQQGGGVVFFLGSEAGEPEEFNRAFWAEGAGLLPLPLTGLQHFGEGGGVGLFRVGEHPVTAIFPAGQAALSEQVRFRAYYATDESAASAGATTEAVASGEQRPVRPAAAVLARFADAAQAPAIIERGFGRGRVLLFTSSVDLDWNDWPRALDGSYVVTMLELAQYASRGDDAPGSLLCGESLTISVPPETYEPRAIIRFAGDEREPPLEVLPDAAAGSVGEPLVLIGPPAERVGTYRAELVRRSGGTELRPLCVNLEPGESDLAVASAAEIEAALGDLPHERVIPADSFLLGRERTRREVWASLLALLVAVLMTEQALAWWFGAPRGVRRAAPQRVGPRRRVGRTTAGRRLVPR
jgi:hypothetical protein